MNQDSPIQRQCMIQDHNGAPIVMRCTQEKCQQPTKWMCLKCKNFHADHLIQCLHIEELTQFLKGDKEKYIVKDRQNIQKQILQELSRQKDLFLSTHQKLEMLYISQFEASDKEEKTNSALYNRVETINPIQLTEEDFSTFQTKSNPQEAIKFQENQLNIFNRLRTCNEQFDKITKSFQELVKANYGEVIEYLDKDKVNKCTFIGYQRFGIKFGQWNIINEDGELIGGGQYNSSGNKHGQWQDVELFLSVSSQKYAKLIGKYQEGKRVGKWEIQQPDGQIIGGGKYDSTGNKHGPWVDVEMEIAVAQQQMSLKFVQYIGKYQEGKRIDKWNIYDLDGQIIKQIAYTKDGIKS